MSETNPYPYGDGDGTKGCCGCRFLDQIFGMEVSPCCLRTEDAIGEIDPDFNNYFEGQWSCWEHEDCEVMK